MVFTSYSFILCTKTSRTCSLDGSTNTRDVMALTGNWYNADAYYDDGRDGQVAGFAPTSGGLACRIPAQQHPK